MASTLMVRPPDLGDRQRPKESLRDVEDETGRDPEAFGRLSFATFDEVVDVHPCTHAARAANVEPGPRLHDEGIAAGETAGTDQDLAEHHRLVRRRAPASASAKTAQKTVTLPVISVCAIDLTDEVQRRVEPALCGSSWMSSPCAAQESPARLSERRMSAVPGRCSKRRRPCAHHERLNSAVQGGDQRVHDRLRVRRTLVTASLRVRHARSVACLLLEDA